MTTLTELYRFKTKNQKISFDYHSAYTKLNPKWRWFKPWVQRFISVPAGYHMHVEINGRLELNIHPVWCEATFE